MYVVRMDAHFAVFVEETDELCSGVEAAVNFTSYIKSSPDAARKLAMNSYQSRGKAATANGSGGIATSGGLDDTVDSATKETEDNECPTDFGEARSIWLLFARVGWSDPTPACKHDTHLS